VDLLPSFKGSVLFSCQSTPNYVAIRMHHRHPTNMQKHQKPFVLVLLQTRLSQDVPRLCLFFFNKESLCALTLHRHCIIHHIQHIKLFFFVFFFFVSLAPRQDGLWTPESEPEFRRTSSTLSLTSVGNNVGAKVDLHSPGVRTKTIRRKVSHHHSRNSHRRRGEMNVFDLETCGSGSARSVPIKSPSSPSIELAVPSDLIAVRRHVN
jgi:hypothetical protein